MKRFVGGHIWSEVIALTVATLAVASLTGAGEDGTFLIASGFLAITITRRRIQEVLDDRPTGPTGAGRSKGSR
jgi:hypothetical protein